MHSLGKLFGWIPTYGRHPSSGTSFRTWISMVPIRHVVKQCTGHEDGLWAWLACNNISR
jgi:hypothetical protein